MKTLDIVRYTAVRGQSVIVDDVLAVDPALRGRDAQAEIQRRAQACLVNFGERAGDRIIRGERYGITHRN
jgi:hypothetical protein